MTRARCALAILVITLFAVGLCHAQQEQNEDQMPQRPPQPVPEISADLGSCSVEFKVTDVAGKPIYDAKIKTQIRYGFLGKRKLDLEAGTNSNGIARFINMPDQVRAPLVFEGTHAGDSMTMTWDPGTNCRAEYPMILYRKGQKQESMQR